MTEKDKGIKAAIRDNVKQKLPSNFTHRVMQQIEREAYLREKHQERRVLFALYTTIACLTIGGGILFNYAYGAQLKELFSSAFTQIYDKDFWLSYLPVIATMPFFCAFNFWLKRKFMK